MPLPHFLITSIMNDYKIWISYHKDELLQKYNLQNDETHKIFATHHDIDGKNINALNTVYSEMVTMYYVWKNSLKSDYVGFNHYRRQFAVDRLPNKGECQVIKMYNFGGQTIYDQYAQHHNAKDMDAIISILNDKYGADNAYTKHIKESNILIGKCCFLMKWTDFTKMCKYLFPVLDAFAEKCGCVTADDWRKKAEKDFGSDKAEYQMRVVSFLAERLISAWISANLTPYIGGMNVAIVHYNTPELVEAAIKSLFKHTLGCHVYVFDNSDKKPFVTTLPNVEVIDNTKGQIIDFEAELEKYPNKWERDIKKSNYGSAKHSMSVDKLMEIVPTGFVLMDSDVLIQHDIKALFDKNVACVGAEEVKHDVPLLMPFLCYLNTPLLKENGIGYFNGEKMWALSDIEPNQHYDTGAWLLEEVRRCNLQVRYINIWQYVLHFGHGSWRGNKQKVDNWLNENAGLWK